MEFEVRESRIPFNNLFKGERILFEEDYEGDLTDSDGNSYAWVKWILNRGYQQIVDGKRTMCKDPRSKLVYQAPTMLDANGRQLPLDGTPLYLGFEPYRTVDFEALQISLNLPE